MNGNNIKTLEGKKFKEVIFAAAYAVEKNNCLFNNDPIYYLTCFGDINLK